MFNRIIFASISSSYHDGQEKEERMIHYDETKLLFRYCMATLLSDLGDPPTKQRTTQSSGGGGSWLEEPQLRFNVSQQRPQQKFPDSVVGYIVVVVVVVVVVVGSFVLVLEIPFCCCCCRRC